MKVFLLLLVFLLVRFEIVAQHKDAFVYEVYNTMYNTMSQGQEIKPGIRISEDTDTIAAFIPIKNELIIGTEFIKLCRNFGKDSNNVAAYVLGHEMAHVLLQQNDLTAQIGSSYASPEYSKQLKRSKKTLRDSIHERQADEFASFYAHIAGYSTSDLGSIILDSIYTHFKLKDKDLPSYPTLSERKRISMQANYRMETLKQVFDFANYATLIGNFSFAQKAYETIIQEKFVSSEIYNNLAVTHLNQALKDIDTLANPYKFPFELDFSTRLYTSERNFDTEYEEHLKKAIKYCDLALGKNQEYAKAWLNKSLAHFLLDEKLDAFYSFEKVKKIKDHSINSSIQWVDAIYAIVNATNESDKQTHLQNYSKIIETNSFTNDVKMDVLDTLKIPTYMVNGMTLKKNNFSYTSVIKFKENKTNYWNVLEMSTPHHSNLIAFKPVIIPNIDLVLMPKLPYFQLNKNDIIRKYKNWILFYSNSELKKCIFISN